MLFVSIVGDFYSSIYPLYNEFKGSISEHIVVDDDAFSERRKHQNIVQSLEKFNKKHKLNIKTYKLQIDEDSLKSIDKLIAKILQLEPDMNKVYINATDGLSNIGILLASKLLERGVHFLTYDMYENSYNITSKNSMQNKKLQSSLGIEDHLELRGLSLNYKGDKEFAHKHQTKILELFNNYSEQMNLLNSDIPHKHLKNKNKYKQALQLVRQMGLDPLVNTVEVGGALYEYYVYLLVKDMGFDDIQVGVEVEQALSKGISVKNEFDVLLMKENHLHMIECKFRKRIEKKELVYQYAALINLVDDDGIIMITSNENIYRHNLYEDIPGISHYRRAFLNRIALRGSIVKNKKEFLEDVQELFINNQM
jgi:hypothetical protein